MSWSVVLPAPVLPAQLMSMSNLPISRLICVNVSSTLASLETSKT
nr:hypothetical protein [Staphylococcus haemolyticus]